MFGSNEHKVAGKRNNVLKIVEAASQFLCQNMRSDRQIKHTTKKDSTFKDFIQTPLPIGLPLAIHSKVREKTSTKLYKNLYWNGLS